MQFEQKTITILDSDRKPVEVTAWQGIGTGLAYHHPIYKDEPSGAEYILVHVPTGMAMTRLTLPTEPEAQAFLEAVAALDPDQWNFDKEEYMKRYYETGRVHGIRCKIEMAHYNALIPRDQIFLYAVHADGDPIDGETMEVESEDPEDAHNKECVAQFFGYYSGDVRVILTRMDYRTGKHINLHTYGRSTTIVAQQEASVKELRDEIAAIRQDMQDKSDRPFEDLKGLGDHLASLKSDEAWLRWMSEG